MAQATASARPAIATASAMPAVPAVMSGGPFFPFYVPSFDVALVGSVVVTVITVVHIFLAYRTKAHYFGLIAKAALMLAVGIILRLVVILEPTAQTPFTISTLLLMVPTTLIAIVLIFTYTRLTWYMTPISRRNLATLWTPPRQTSFTIVVAQAICDLIGFAGQGQFFPSPGPRTTAIGAVLEMLVWMTFAMLVVRFVLISRRWSLPPEVDREGAMELGYALIASAVLLVIRGIYAVMEKDALATLIATKRPASIVTTEEWPTWVFGIAPPVLVLVIMAVYHPGFYLPKRLTGFRLKCKQLEKEKKLGMDGATQASNGWVISTPFPINGRDEKSGRVMLSQEELGTIGAAR